MRGQSFLWLLIVVSPVASDAAAEPAPRAAWFGGGSGLDAGMLTLHSQRITTDANTLGQASVESWTLTFEPTGPEGAPRRRVLWRDERSWTGLGVGPTTSRLHLRPEHDDAIVVLTYTESASGWGDAVCVDVFKVALAEPTGEPSASPPAARLLRPRTGHVWLVADILLGDQGILVVLRGRPELSQMYYLDLATAQWRDVGTGGVLVDGIVEQRATLIRYEPGEPVTIPAPTSRPLPTQRNSP